MSKPYEAKFEAGERVRIASREHLEQFKREWHYHDPLTDEQLGYAGAIGLVEEVGFYHGGEPLYQLKAVPGVWHEGCLSGA
jgi:hypothetical protein